MITIRRYQPKDQAAVKSLITHIMSEEFGEAKNAYPTDDVENIDDSYGNLGEAFFVAVDGEKVIGCVGIKKEDERTAMLRRLFVAKDYRRRQIGMKLIDRAIEFCQEVGYDELIFKTTSQMVGAIHTCQKKGFVQRAHIALGSIELLKFVFLIHKPAKASK